jgi:Cys-tRNA synthase (O-phospho-L-seryl-tRNA:Cys-tRNA synthase)
VYKVFSEQEFESLGFLAAGAGVVALLASRPARVHAGVTR